MMTSFIALFFGFALLIRRERYFFVLLLLGLSAPFSGCDNTDMQLATDAGIDAYKAMINERSILAA